MTHAALAPRDLPKCIEGLTALLQQLEEECMVRVLFVALDAAEVATWSASERTLRVRADAPIQFQLWSMIDVWFQFSVGSSVPTAMRPLSIIPPPRPPLALVKDQ